MPAYQWMPKKRSLLHCSLTTRGIVVRQISLLQRVRSGQRFWDRSPMFKTLALSIFLIALACLHLGCRQQREPAGTVTMLIESSPTNLDPRIGVDAQSERIDSLIFDSLVRKDAHFDLQPWLAVRWENP